MTNSVSKRITAQDIFSAAWQAFIVEGKPPAQETNEYGEWGCKYLTKDGRKCAVGLCIPDGHPYQKSTMSFIGLMNIEMLAEKKGEETAELLFDEEFHRDSRLRETIQGYLHDIYVAEGNWLLSPERLKQIYRDFAKDHHLTIPGEEPNASGVE